MIPQLRKITPSIFAILFLLPIALIYLNKINLEFARHIQMATFALWILFILEFFRRECKDKKYFPVIYTIFALELFDLVISLFFEPISGHILITYLIISLLHITMVVLLTIKIREVFYSRSVWFIVIELLVFPIAIFTLTPEIGRYEKEELKTD